jgi:CDP-glucose 4,6-dehydratase
LSAGRALVTGGHGFVGSHLAAALLLEGWEVRVLDRPGPRQTDLGGPRRSGLDLLGIGAEVELHEADLLDAGEASSAARGRDAVFHLAAQTIVGLASRAPRETFEVNVRGAWNVFEASRDQGVAAVVFASSDKAYGTAPELPYREDFPLRGTYPYDASKAAADTIARCYAVAGGLPLAVTRFANVYGGGDLNFTRLIPETARALCEGRAPRIRSDGSPKRDFLHVEDAVAAYLAIAAAVASGAAAPGEAFNAGGDRPHTVREVVDLIAAAAGGGIAPSYGPGLPAGEIADQYLDSTKLRELTGWSPRVELPRGLARTLEWYRDHPEVLP